MKKGLFTLILLLLLLCLFQSALAEEAKETDEWTLLIYICGSDLESKYSCATGNLEEIATVKMPHSIFAEVINSNPEIKGDMYTGPGKVNVLIETGGAKAWHAQELGMDIRADALQRWRYDAAVDTAPGAFILEDERPLANMANPDTLSDFIRWGTENYPAKKYGLMLWSHGGGSATGIFIDELFGGDFMTLDLLNKALSDGGARFEAVLFDACMMANLETACAIQDHANWMIASEELVAGKGTAVGEWLQQLYCVPNVDGRLLGRWICDTAMIKYGNSDDKQAQELITWSVLDLSKVKRFETIFDNYFARISIFYAKYPAVLLRFASAPFSAEEYGTGHENMYDFGGILYHSGLRESQDVDRQRDMQDALADVVNYCVRGAGRPAARGLSFCYATNFSGEKLEVYAHNCPSPHYLALLDAISDWEAPGWVYEQVDKLPELMDEGVFQVTIDKKTWKNGSPAFIVAEGEMFISTVEYSLYRKDKATGQTVRMGTVPVYYDPDADMYRVYDLTKWPSFDGSLCQIELQNKITDKVYNILYNIPMMIDSELMNMRCVYWFDKADYEVLGVWEGYDNDSSLFSRNVRSLSQLAGREYNLLYEVYGEQRGSRPYLFSPTMIMYRSMDLEEITLPAGTYYIEFVIYDVFMRPMYVEPVELILDGDTVKIQGESWEGTQTLKVSTASQHGTEK